MSTFWMKGEEVLVTRNKRKYLGRLIYYVQPGTEKSNVRSRVKPYVLLGKQIDKSRERSLRQYQEYDTADDDDLIVSPSQLNLRKQSHKKTVMGRARDYVTRRIFKHRDISLGSVEDYNSYYDPNELATFRTSNLSPRSTDISLREVDTPRSTDSKNVIKRKYGTAERPQISITETIDKEKRCLPNIPITPLTDQNLNTLGQPTYGSIIESINSWLSEIEHVDYSDELDEEFMEELSEDENEEEEIEDFDFD